MAITHKVIRGHLARIIELRRNIIPALSQEIYELGHKLGVGTYRTKEYPCLKVEVRGAQVGGYRVSWKDVTKSLAKRYHIPQTAIEGACRQHRTYQGYTAQSVYVSADKVKAPKGVIV